MTNQACLRCRVAMNRSTARCPQSAWVALRPACLCAQQRSRSPGRSLARVACWAPSPRALSRILQPVWSSPALSCFLMCVSACGTRFCAPGRRLGQPQSISTGCKMHAGGMVVCCRVSGADTTAALHSPWPAMLQGEYCLQLKMDVTAGSGVADVGGQAVAVPSAPQSITRQVCPHRVCHAGRA